MTTYQRTETVQAVHWQGPDAEAEALAIVDWVNANGGEARYEPGHPWSYWGTTCVCCSGPAAGRSIHAARIAVRSLKRWDYATADDWIVVENNITRGPDVNASDSNHSWQTMRATFVLSSAQWAAQGWLLSS